MEPTVSQKVQMLINLCASACPASKDVVLVEDASLLSDGVGSYSFKIGRFWSSIKNNFVEGGGRHMCASARSTNRLPSTDCRGCQTVWLSVRRSELKETLVDVNVVVDVFVVSQKKQK